MKRIRLWRVRHRSDERDAYFTVRYAMTEKTGSAMASRPWGVCGTTGECDKVEFNAYETLDEALDREEADWIIDTSHIGA